MTVQRHTKMELADKRTKNYNQLKSITKNNIIEHKIKGSKGDIYTVFATKNNSILVCNCLGFQYRKRCWHTNSLKKSNANN